MGTEGTVGNKDLKLDSVVVWGDGLTLSECLEKKNTILYLISDLRWIFLQVLEVQKQGLAMHIYHGRIFH